MKRCMNVLLSGILVISMTTSLHISANDDKIIKTDVFSYDPTYREFELKMDLLIRPYDSMQCVCVVANVGERFGETVYVTSVISGNGSKSCSLMQSDITKFLPEYDLKIGDVICLHNWGIAQLDPPFYQPMYEWSYVNPKRTEIYYVGSGEKMFGEKFTDVLRYMSTYPYLENCTRMDDSLFVYGDANDDGAVDILDVIQVNRYLFGADTLDKYEKLWADVDQNDSVDEADSLAILKEVIGLTTNFAET